MSFEQKEELHTVTHTLLHQGGVYCLLAVETCNKSTRRTVACCYTRVKTYRAGTCYSILHQKFKFPKNENKTKMQTRVICGVRRMERAGSSEEGGNRAASSSRPGRGEGLYGDQRVNVPRPSFSTSKTKRVSHRGGGAGRAGWGQGTTRDEGRAVSFGGLEGEGELGPGLALAEDDFLLLLLLPLTVLLQLHALLVNLSLLLHNTQLLFGLWHTRSRNSKVRLAPTKCSNTTVSAFL